MAYIENTTNYVVSQGGKEVTYTPKIPYINLAFREALNIPIGQE